MSDGVRPYVRLYPARAEPYKPPESESAIMCEIKSLIAAAGAAPKPIVVHAIDAAGGHHAFVSWPEGDRALAALVAAAGIPVDYEIVGVEPWAEKPPPLSAELAGAASAKASARRRRRALVDERLAAAADYFSATEAEARKRTATRRGHEVFVRYAAARLAAARRRRAEKAKRGPPPRGGDEKSKSGPKRIPAKQKTAKR